MPNLWIRALDNYAKHNGFNNRAEVIRSLFYPAFLKELKLLDPEVKIEPIIEHKKRIKKSSVARKFKKAMKLIIKKSESIPRALVKIKPRSTRGKISAIRFVQNKNKLKEQEKPIRTQLKDHINIEKKEKPFKYLKDALR